MHESASEARATIPEDPFAGPGEVRALAREIDWGATPLGPVERWPATLRGAVRTCLDSPFPINLWCGEDLTLVYNDAYRAVLGDKHPASLASPGSEVWAEIWDEIGPMFEQIRGGGPPVFAEDAPFVIERAGDGLLSSADGQEPNAWFTFSLSAVRDDAGRVVSFLNIVSESTGRVVAERAREAARERAERAEARLREVFAQAPAFLAVLRGREHVVEYVNAAYYQLVGQRDLVGRPLFEGLPDVRGQGFEGLLDRVLETGEPFVGREVPATVVRSPDSEPEQRFIDLVYYPITEADGTRSGVVAHGADVTDHVLARREAQRARADAEHANQAKSQFLANMSHEIRTPINAVMGYADLLDAGVAGDLSAPQRAYLERIRASSHHLLGLVNDILDLSKIEAGGMRVRMEEDSADAVAAGALEMVAPQAEARGIVLRQERDVGVRFVGDTDRVRQVVLNLLANAVKFTEPGGSITVRCRHVAEAPSAVTLPVSGPWVSIEVEDTGSGIPEEQLGRIFEPFVQAENAPRRRASGTGLGLTISRRFARLMGGEITVRSTPGQGSCFTLWLEPAAREARFHTPQDWARTLALPGDPRGTPGLGAVAHTLLAGAEEMETALVERLRSDPEIPGASTTGATQLADHTAVYLALLAKALLALDEGGGEPLLLRDGEELRAFLASRHGQQRRRLGWTPGEVAREYEILHEVLDGHLRREAPLRTAADLAGALSVVHRLLDRAREASLSAFDRADADADPS